MDIFSISTALMILLGLLFISLCSPKQIQELQHRFYPNSSTLSASLCIITTTFLVLFLSFEKIIVVYLLSGLGVYLLVLLMLVFERSLLYISSLVFVIVAVILEITGMRVFAEELTGLAFIVLVISVFQDVLYEKIINH